MAELTEAYRAIACINNLLQQAPRSLREKFRIEPVHANALIDLLNAALDHRFQEVKATLEAMQAAHDD